MSDIFEQRLAALQQHGSRAFDGALTGLEKECLRVAPDGYLANSDHPDALGSALTNRFITTDFSEALLEFVTPAYNDPRQTLQCLRDLHQFTMSEIGDELLWNASMPCLIGDDQSIPLARYGTSNVARMKTIYRRGLSYRYGRAMQAIAGVHFNFSLPDRFFRAFQDLAGSSDDLQAFRSSAYLNLARNFRRVGWIVLYLFGASPAMCKSFLGDRKSALAEFDKDTLFEPFATSLRMSDLGYNSNAQSTLSISLNSLQEYIDDLTAAIMTPHEPYKKIGVKVRGEWRQLNANILQIENEYYNTIRPKQVARTGERPTLALQRGGVQYVEIRSLDINPFDPIGINETQMYYMQALLMYCLLEECRPLDSDQLAELRENHGLVAHSGRAPALALRHNGQSRPLQSWARDVHEKVGAVAEWLDGGEGAYSQAWRDLQPCMDDSDATPSARVLREMRESGLGFNAYVMQQAEEHTDYFRQLPRMADDLREVLVKEAKESRERQQHIEQATQRSFDEYLADYFRT